MQRVSVFLPLILLISIIITFIVLQPTSAAQFPPNKENSWNAFLTDMQQKKRMDTQEFWKFREFYSPGSFIFKKTGIPLSNSMNELGIASFQNSNPTGLLQYNSTNLTSADALIPEDNISSAYQDINTIREHTHVLASGENFVIGQTSPKNAEIYFVATNDEMMRANGYASDDKDLVKGKAWISVSEIKLP